VKNSDAVARYWRKSLFDSSYAHVTIGEGTRDGFLLQDGGAGEWRVHKDVLRGINHTQGGSFLLGIGGISRSTGRESMRHITPILLVPVLVDREGRTAPDFDAGGPWIQRALFFRPFSFADSEKSEWKVSTYPLLGNAGEKPVEDLPWENRWQVAMPMIDKLLKLISGGVNPWSRDNGAGFLEDMRGKVPEGWVVEKSVFFIPTPASEINRTKMTGPLLVAYDQIMEAMMSGKPPELINNFTRTGEHLKHRAQPLGMEDPIYTMQAHVAQIGDAFPLDRDQRRAAQTAAVMENGDILAVEGPPGTGKTALIQALVADVTVKSALTNPDQPGMVLISSSNNQAIENVLEVFANCGGYQKETALLTQRWLPSIGSVGLHLAAYSRVANVDTSLWKWPTYFPGMDSITTISQMRDDFLSGLSWETYRTMFAKQFGGAPESPEAAAKSILEEIKKIAESSRAAIGEYRKIQESLDKAWSLKKRHGYEIGIESTWRERLRNVKAVYDQEVAVDASTATRMMQMIPGAKKKREEQRNAALKKAGIDTTWDNMLDRMRGLAMEIKEASILTKQLTEAFGDEATLEGIGHSVSECEQLKEKDEYLDTTQRSTMFWLSVHFWEARWLSEMSKRKPNTRGQIPAWDYATDRKMSEEGWKLRFMAFPVMVSTLYSAPRFFSSKNRELLIEMLDLVIIDEAGQVSPELGLPTIALGQKLVMLGDESQTEPIWTTSEEMDRENLAVSEIKGYEKYEDIQDMGITAFGTSLQARAYATDTTGHQRLEKDRHLSGSGITLSIHRRSCEPVMQLFNRISYHGRLQCARALNEKAISHGLEPLQYMHIPSFSKKSGESRVNEIEARSIASWVAANRERLTGIYEVQSLEKVLGIVTPYAAQAVTITNALRAAGVMDHITVGTIHKLQGAEREMVIFSPTVGYGDSTSFFDGAANMINVATSRAKDCLMIAGNLDMTPAAPTAYSRTVAYLVERGKEVYMNGAMQKNMQDLDDYGFDAAEIDWGESLKEQVQKMIEGLKASEVHITMGQQADLEIFQAGHGVYESIMKAITDNAAKVTIFGRPDWGMKDNLDLSRHASANVTIKTAYAPYTGSTIIAASERATCAMATSTIAGSIADLPKKRVPGLFFCGHAVKNMIKSG
jgi:hypothetical protein